MEHTKKTCLYASSIFIAVQYVLYIQQSIAVKKGKPFSCPQPGCRLQNSSWPRIIKLFPARESLVSDIPAGDGKMAYLFLQSRDQKL